MFKHKAPDLAVPIPQKGLEENIFDIVNQLNVGIDTINQPAEKTQLAKLNLTAGRKAKAAAAYEAAVRYLRVAMKLLPADCWQIQYDLTLAIYESTAEAEYLNINYEDSKKLLDIVLQKAKNLLEKVMCMNFKSSLTMVKIDL
jgi:Predicted ATPase